MLSTTLDSLQNSNAIDVLTDILRSNLKRTHSREVSNQILNTIYNMCRLNKSRQEDAALNGMVPLLQKIVTTERPLKEFALPILCDMAQSGKVGRRELWRNKGLGFYISLLQDPYWQVTALDAIHTWYVPRSTIIDQTLTMNSRLQEETAKVEEHLLEGTFEDESFTDAVVNCLEYSKTNAFENTLEPLQKLLRLSPQVASTFVRADLFTRLRQKLHHSKAAVRLNLLRIIASICDSHEEQTGLLATYGLLDSIRNMENDPAILVRDMAGKLVRSSEAFGVKRRPTTARRQSTSTPPPIYPGSATPSTPSSNRTGHPRGYLDGRETPRHPRKSLNVPSLALRPGSRDGGSSSLGSSINSNNAAAARPRSTRPLSSRMSHVEMLRKEDSSKTPNSLSRRPSIIPRRRRPTLADHERT